MPEAFEPSDLPADKAERYARLVEEIALVLHGETNRIARMATTCAMLASAFPDFLWTGFYLADPQRPGELVVGPYQGALGCLRIPPGSGVCGEAARRREALIVPDVAAFPGHIACDSRSASEIVVPILDGGGELIGVLDVDSARLAAFDEADRAGLEAAVKGLLAA
ncbi:MAG: GAF domain-containing protein [Caulobacteraceae bacterium]